MRASIASIAIIATSLLVCCSLAGIAADAGQEADANAPQQPRYHSVVPYLNVDDSVAAIAFYAKAFGAKPLFSMPGPDGKKVVHAEVLIGDSVVMLMDSDKEKGLKSPKDLGGSPVSLQLFVQDVDVSFKRAVDAGAHEAMAPADQPWGARYAIIVDPFGHTWAFIGALKDAAPKAAPEPEPAPKDGKKDF